MLLDYGEEFLVRVVFTEEATKPESLEVGLYHDRADQLSGFHDIDDITTEPDTGDYERLVYDFGEEFSAEINGRRNWRAVFDQKTFELTSTVGVVDSYFATVEFEAEDDNEPAEHLIVTGRLRDLRGNSRSETLDDLVSMTLSPELIFR